MAQGPKNPVTEAVDSCIVYWVAAGLPRAQIDQMAAELRAHLEQAVAAGKSVEAVIGGDVARFAEEWWRPGRHQPRWQALCWRRRSSRRRSSSRCYRPSGSSRSSRWRRLTSSRCCGWQRASGSCSRPGWVRAGWPTAPGSATAACGWGAAVTFVGMLVLSPAMPWVPEWVLLEIPRWQAVLVMVGCLVINGLAILRDPTRPRAPASLP
ncbi:hypothetical protein [Thermaerobacter sp. FW80]|uniref:hypothetical protein n=1 Tax=Thermaerobacter sp. FW80 TaxID=2546351 RepID=UPI001FAA58D9|nr:hypothetical protein [Thermaerobacter sp. FW80]